MELVQSLISHFEVIVVTAISLEANLPLCSIISRSIVWASQSLTGMIADPESMQGRYGGCSYSLEVPESIILPRLHYLYLDDVRSCNHDPSKDQSSAPAFYSIPLGKISASDFHDQHGSQKSDFTDSDAISLKGRQ